ncbi:MAG TPA: 30S ribosomal protein S14 [Gemmatimonadaceae bacterium]|nr:30S ribosomal protein S14 [Gemmatimonadaceae bacterium]
MAKTSKIVKNRQRQETVARYAARRQELKATIQNPQTTPEAREAAQRALRALPRDASPTRVRNRCQMTGRPRAYLRQFGLSRITFREMALAGLIPGVRKASW